MSHFCLEIKQLQQETTIIANDQNSSNTIDLTLKQFYEHNRDHAHM